MTNVRSFNRKPKKEPLLTHQVHCNVTPKDFTKAKTLKLSWNQLLNMGINSADVLRNLRTKDLEIYNLKQRIENSPRAFNLIPIRKMHFFKKIAN